MRASGFSVSVTKKRKKKCSRLSPNHRKTGENYCVKCRRTFQSPVHWDSVNHWINLHPLDNAIGFRNILIHWIVVYQANGAIHLLNKEDLELNSISKFKRQFRKRKNILLSLVCILPRKRMWAFSRRSRAEVAKKGTEKVCCKCRDVVYCFVNVIAAVAVVGS